MAIQIDVKTAQEILGETGTYVDNGDGFVGKGDTVVKKSFAEDLSTTTKPHAVGEKGTDLAALAADLSAITDRKIAVLRQDKPSKNTYLFVDQKAGVDSYRVYLLGAVNYKGEEEDYSDGNKLAFLQKGGAQAPALESQILMGIKQTGGILSCDVDKKDRVSAGCARRSLMHTAKILDQASETQAALAAEKILLESALTAWGQGAIPSVSDLETLEAVHGTTVYHDGALARMLEIYGNKGEKHALR